MPQIKETILAPSLDSGEWLQGERLSLADAHGRNVVLLDFWDYTCVNCLRTLPYVAEWHRRYARDGLTVVGVHAPEFSFARDQPNVAAAIKEQGLDYPIVLDNAYAIWRAYSNRSWPAKYLIDAEGRLRYYHFGEGLYVETETQIQKLLLELNPTLELSAPMGPLRDTDRPGAVCYRVTPELYLGYARGQFGNPAGVVQDKSFEYRDPGHHVGGLPYLGGRWSVGSEAAQAEDEGAAIVLRYTAMEVNLVLAPPAGAAARLEVMLGEGQCPGSDVKLESGRLFVTVDRPRMYSLIANESVVSGTLRLAARDVGWNAFAFTFISCAAT
jgi:thiol-disulfide isomerase/thioredoxin